MMTTPINESPLPPCICGSLQGRGGGLQNIHTKPNMQMHRRIQTNHFFFTHYSSPPPGGERAQYHGAQPFKTMSRAAILLLLSSLFNRALCQDGCSGLSSAARVVSTPQDASALTSDLIQCPGLEFNVFWRGSTVLLEPLQLSNSTILRITSLEASLLDGGQQQLFVVSGSSVLSVEGMGLTGGQGDSGAVVAASGGASVTFVDCDVYGNKASSNGGVYVCAR